MAVITLTGPTCAGKSTVERELQKLGCGRAISHTTRAPRVGEVDGVEYHFISEDEFSRAKMAGEFVETIEFGTARYAMSAAALEKAHRDSQNVVIVVEPVGASQILEYCERNGLKTLPCWLDCNPAVQADRWVHRLKCELMTGRNVGDAYAERLGIMLSMEVEWRRNAYEGRLDGHWTYFYMNHHTEQRQPHEIAQAIFSLKQAA